MAELSPTSTGQRVPVGKEYEVTFTVTTGGGLAAADEWVDVPGLKEITKLVGHAILGAAGDAATLNFVLNASGTGVAAGTNPGNLGIEAAEASTPVTITVRGI